MSHCHWEPRHPATVPIAAQPPAVLHPCFSPPPGLLSPDVQQIFSPPSFHVFASVSLSCSGKSLHEPSTKACFSSSHTTLQPVHLPVSHLHTPAHFKHVPCTLQIKGTKMSLSSGLHTRPPNPAEGNSCPECSTSALTDMFQDGQQNQSSPAAPELGTEGAAGGGRDLQDHVWFYLQQTAVCHSKTFPCSSVTAGTRSIPPHLITTPCMPVPCPEKCQAPALPATKPYIFQQAECAPCLAAHTREDTPNSTLQHSSEV